jgi:hypothetical protein
METLVRIELTYWRRGRTLVSRVSLGTEVERPPAAVYVAVEARAAAISAMLGMRRP